MSFIETEYYEVNELTKKEKRWGSFAHLSTLLIFIFSFLGLIAPFLILKLNKNNSFISKQAKEALNLCFNIIMINIVSFLIFKSYLIFLINAFLFVYALYHTINAFKLAQKGISYFYPYILRFLRD
jgi:uncharacterized Tic20 family protein